MAENFELTDDDLRSIIIECHGDMRHTIVTMSLAALTNSVAVNKATVLTEVNSFEATKRLFSAKTTYDERTRLASRDDMLSLFVHENYTSTHSSLDQIARAADSMSLGNLVEYSSRDIYDILSVVTPTTLTSGASLSEQVAFPSLLGSGSSAKRQRKTSSALAHKFGGDADNNYLLYSLLCAPFAEKSVTHAHIDRIVATMIEYDFDIDDLTSLASLAISSPPRKNTWSMTKKDRERLVQTYEAARETMLQHAIKQRIERSECDDTTNAYFW